MNPFAISRVCLTSVLLCVLMAVGCNEPRHEQPGRAALDAPQDIPVQLIAGRFIVCPVAKSGSSLRIFTDTGGCPSFLYASAVERLGLSTESVELGQGHVTLASLPMMRTGSSIPSNSIEYDPRPQALRGWLLVRQDEVRPSGDYDGVLGPEWFGDRVWTFDYPGRRLLLHSSSTYVVFDPQHTISLGFLTEPSGKRETHFPSIDATIDGQTYAFLFDTGATVNLSDTALSIIGDGGPHERATSFITASVFEKWRGRHPNWRTIEGADRNAGGERIIEVPQVTIAGYTVGPVWFTRRADSNFHEYMSQWMDRRVEGALGGSLFKYFVVTADYPGSRAYFRLAGPPGAE